MSLQNCQKLENLLGNIEIFPAQNQISLAQNSIFLNCFPTFVNGFLLSSTAFQFSSMAFHFPRNPRKSIYGSKYPKDCYSSFVFPTTCSPSFVSPATMSTSPPTDIPAGYEICQPGLEHQDYAGKRPVHPCGHVHPSSSRLRCHQGCCH